MKVLLETNPSTKLKHIFIDVLMGLKKLKVIRFLFKFLSPTPNPRR